MKTALIIDTETTGLDPEDSEIIEIGAILYSIQHQTPLVCLSALSGPVVENSCQHINRIPPAATRAMTPEATHAAKLLFYQMSQDCDVILAHNVEFDRQWYPDLETKHWLCTMDDFDWAPHSHVNGKSLVNIALAHGIGVSTAHRALTDCQLIAELLNRHHDLNALFARASRPKAIYRAMVSYDDNHLAKAVGFRWNPDGKVWWKKMAIEDAESGDLGFRVVKMQDCE